jgi:hypothetical protein
MVMKQGVSEGFRDAINVQDFFSKWSKCSLDSITTSDNIQVEYRS